MGRQFHVNGITVNNTTQTVESAAARGVVLPMSLHNGARVQRTRINTACDRMA
jgi:hypothetical protein